MKLKLYKAILEKVCFLDGLCLLDVGLYLCFFQIPEAAHMKSDGISIVGQKDLFLQIEQYRAEAADQFPRIV